jgi:hypothetical protein
MKTLTGATTTELSKTVTQPGYFVEIVWSETTTSLLTSLPATTTLSWNSRLWTPKDIRVRLSAQDGRAGASLQLVIGNDSQAFGGLILSNGINGKPVRVWKGYYGALAASDPVLVFDGSGDGASIAPDTVTVSAIMDRLAWMLCPRKRINASTGFTKLLPAGSRITIGNQTIILERRS